ncbi:GNAT family N-acetyltransferase [Jidongwangia harbinensis]|uniref:GNAT family N-acetyltransferase n=1 Tax=Jidongwangia harbinensis TaxID=2878561 RepID=UPI001CD98890|nr:GNAT family N-acetyltransferase [Jidongwangia harbinensis]MCA2214426.1 GNAT family N-acetyltransferase [Jidongwangia harbinensis]
MLRAAVAADRDTVLTWRNHPEVRSVSLTTHVIPPEEHAAWWAAATADPNRRVLIFEDDGQACGVVMFDCRGDVPTWGFYLDVAGLTARNALLPAWMRLEREAVDYAFDDLKVERLGGETLAANKQVLALHRRFGFRETRRYERLVDGTPQTVVWTERGRA